MSALYDKDGIDGPFEKAISKPLQAPPWPRCTRCAKPCAPAHMELDELGKPYCSGGRCGTAQVEEVSQSTLRRQVYLRDGGVCSACGLDAEKLRAEVDGLKVDRAAVHDGWNRWYARVFLLKKIGFDEDAIENGSPFWEAAHVEARVLGGATHLSQAVTLCLPCHKTDTRNLASDRASKRRPFRRGR